MDEEPLILLPIEKWRDLQAAFKSDWPRGISCYSILDTQKRWKEQGLVYDFQVYCPHGDVWNGMVAIMEKKIFSEIVIQCPQDDTRILEEALRRTKLIDWTKSVKVPFAPTHIVECIKRIVDHVSMTIELILPSETFILPKEKMRLDISLPSDVTFGPISEDYIDLVDSKWPYRFPGSTRYFQLLLQANSGFGLFKDQKLVSWVFINDAGALGHMFTLEEHRRKGYAKLLLMLISNVVLDEKKDVFAFCVKGNSACKLYEKFGFEFGCGVAWCYLESK